jgi:hypothetical protein
MTTRRHDTVVTVLGRVLTTDRLRLRPADVEDTEATWATQTPGSPTQLRPWSNS